MTLHKRVSCFAICVIIVIFFAAGHLFADCPCLTDFLPMGKTYAVVELPEVKLQYKLPKEIVLEGIKKALLINEETRTLKQDLIADGAFETAPGGHFTLERPLLVETADGRKYRIREGTTVEYTLIQSMDFTYTVVIPSGTVLERGGDDSRPLYRIAEGSPVYIMPHRNQQALLGMAGRTVVDRIPALAGMGTTLQVSSIRAPTGGYVDVTIQKSGFDFSNAHYQVCFRKQPENSETFSPFFSSNAVKLKEVQPGKALLQARIPKIPGISGLHWPEPVDLLVIARTKRQPETSSASSVEQSPAGFWANEEIAEAMEKGFEVSSRPLAIMLWIGIAILTWFIAALTATLRAGQRRYDPIWFVSGRYGSASVSLTQILLWTLLVVSSSFYVWAASGKLLDITGDILTLLGIAGASSILAKVTAASGSRRNGQEIPAAAITPKWIHLFHSEGRPDLLKFQMLIFTTLAAVFVIGKIGATFAFPEVPEGLLALIGISNGVYLGGKVSSAVSPDPSGSQDNTTPEPEKDPHDPEPVSKDA